VNRVAAITCQLGAIAEHITGPEAYSLTSLCEVRDAILDAHDLIAGEILKGEKAPDYLRQLTGSTEPPKGGRA
jgi:hypothetical protein